MVSQTNHEQFSQIHIDVARNATDDFNLFHDSHKWSRILQNPFKGPIVLGFQIESLIENKIYHHRQINNENNFIIKNNLNFSNYQFSFANAIKPGQGICVDVKQTTIAQSTDITPPSLSNRVSVKAGDKLALIGFKKETQLPLFLPEPDFNRNFEALKTYADRSFIKANILGKKNSFFLKRKFINVSNAKNFLCGSMVDQRLFFDELENKYQFPEIFPCAFISCALLEKFMQNGLDFERSPMVYLSHKISVDRQLLSTLKSNDILHILIHLQEKKTETNIKTYECYGLVRNNAILFRSLVDLISLESILKTVKK